jgi:hypothetical protein
MIPKLPKDIKPKDPQKEDPNDFLTLDQSIYKITL